MGGCQGKGQGQGILNGSKVNVNAVFNYKVNIIVMINVDQAEENIVQPYNEYCCKACVINHLTGVVNGCVTFDNEEDNELEKKK